MPDVIKSTIYSFKVVHGELRESVPIGHIPSGVVVQVSESGASAGPDVPVHCELYGEADVRIVGMPLKTDKYGQVHISFEAGPRWNNPGHNKGRVYFDLSVTDNHGHVAKIEIERLVFTERYMAFDYQDFTMAVGDHPKWNALSAHDLGGGGEFPFDKYHIKIDSGTTGLKLIPSSDGELKIDGDGLIPSSTASGHRGFGVEGATAPGVATVTASVDPSATYPVTSDPKLAVCHITVVPKA